MAGDWIKMRSNLWDDPRVSRLCDLTDQGEAAVIGALYWLWAAADQHTETGVMTGLSLRQVDRKTGLAGFGQALCDIGWIAECEGGVCIVNFEEHNGTSAKKRSTEARRKSEIRKGEPPKRKYVSAKQKERIFEADGHKCVYCGRHKDDGTPFNEDPSYYALSVDHLVPVSQGGDNSDANMVTACMPCNMKKNGRAPEECGMVPDLSERKRTGFGQVSPETGQDAELEKEREKEKEKKKNKPSTSAKRRRTYTPEFEEFWSAYPKKSGKGDAQDAWTKINPNAELKAKILWSLEAQKRSHDWTKENGKYIPNPSTWLNQDRWEDELTPAEQGAVGGFKKAPDNPYGDF